MTFITHKLLLLITVLIPLSASCSQDIEPLNTSTLTELFQFLASNDQSTTRVLHIANDIPLIATLSGTSKGNGTITIHNIVLRIFDQHDDGVVYENGVLSLATGDLNNDGMNEIIISGIIKYTGEKETDPASYEALTLIYQLDCTTGFFKKLFHSGNYSPELALVKSKAISCGKE